MGQKAVKIRLVERPAFDVVGKKTWISGQDNDQFCRFWQQCREDGSIFRLRQLSDFKSGAQTGGVVLGISQVEADPSIRVFYFMVAVENPAGEAYPDLECYRVPAGRWAVFQTWGLIPDALVRAEIYAFSQWLPASGFKHAAAPELEVYPPCKPGENREVACEFWLPID
jgi:AraC family transcriptional regulator